MCSGRAVGGGGHRGEGGQEVAARDADAGGVDQQLLVAVVDLGVRPPHRPQRRLRAQRLPAADLKYIRCVSMCNKGFQPEQHSHEQILY